jgi:HJR/Mrr/RecB family endonuclease
VTDQDPSTGQHQPRGHYQAAPGWYADPSGAARWRYFDGHQWTNHVHVAAEIHQPQPQAQAAVVRSSPQDQSQAATATPDLDPARDLPDLPDLDAMSGVEFENFVAGLYRSRGFEAEVTKASGDFGADLIVASRGGLRRSEWDSKSYDSDGWSSRMAVQCKRYSGAVGVSAVTAIIAGKGMYDCARSAVVTNSTFTAQGREMAEAHSVALIDGARLRQMHQASQRDRWRRRARSGPPRSRR